MGYALEYLNYEGTLIQLHGADAAVMRVVHRVENGVPTERITAMDEVGREIIRRGDDVTCILPDQNEVLIGEGAGAGRAQARSGSSSRATSISTTASTGSRSPAGAGWSAATRAW